MIDKRIKELRLSNDLTQKDLADYLGLTPKMISFYELGQRIPPIDILLKLAEKFNVTTDYLLGNDAPASAPLPFLTPKDEREIDKDLEKIVESLRCTDTMGDSEDQEDMEMLKATLRQAMVLSKRIAKKKFTPKKYRKD